MNTSGNGNIRTIINLPLNNTGLPYLSSKKVAQVGSSFLSYFISLPSSVQQDAPDLRPLNFLDNRRYEKPLSIEEGSYIIHITVHGLGKNPSFCSCSISRVTKISPNTSSGKSSKTATVHLEVLYRDNVSYSSPPPCPFFLRKAVEKLNTHYERPPFPQKLFSHNHPPSHASTYQSAVV